MTHSLMICRESYSMKPEHDPIEAERSWLEGEMTERLYRLRQVEGRNDPITEHRRERELNEAIDQYSDLLRMIGQAATLGAESDG